jgi:hypothetical protein
MADAPRLRTPQPRSWGALLCLPLKSRPPSATPAPAPAPGLDGLPSDLYRRFKALLLPLLSRLFSAIGTTGTLPPGFHDGVITCLYKQGDRTHPGNYRPITLLNTDYRLLGQGAGRPPGCPPPHHPSPPRAAFLRGRRLGENVLLLQLLPPPPSPGALRGCGLLRLCQGL